MRRDDPAVQWLLESEDPSVRYFTLVDILGVSPDSRQARAARRQIPEGARVGALLAGQRSARRSSSGSHAIHPGGFGVHPY